MLYKYSRVGKFYFIQSNISKMYPSFLINSIFSEWQIWISTLSNNDNIKMQQTIENSTVLQFDPAGNVINLSNLIDNILQKMCTNFWIKISTFVPTIKKFNTKLLDEEINDFYQHIQLKAHFRDNTKVKELKEEEIFKKPTNKKWAPNKNHDTIETFVETTKSRIKDELNNIHRE